MFCVSAACEVSHKGSEAPLTRNLRAAGPEAQVTGSSINANQNRQPARDKLAILFAEGC